jgi:hypothetical protein
MVANRTFNIYFQLSAEKFGFDGNMLVKTVTQTFVTKNNIADLSLQIFKDDMFFQYF